MEILNYFCSIIVNLSQIIAKTLGKSIIERGYLLLLSFSILSPPKVRTHQRLASKITHALI